MTMTNETIDELRAYDLRIIQPGSGYRFSLDPLRLCDFAGVRAVGHFASRDRIVGKDARRVMRPAPHAATGVRLQGRNVWD